MYIDLLAVGPMALERGAVTFSQTGTIMNLTGFDLALQSLVPVDFGATPLAELAQPITRAPTPVVVLLKMGAFLDRPERERDLEDIAYVLQNYLPSDDIRRFEAPLSVANLTFEHQSAYALGLDLGQVAQSQHRELADRFIATMLGPDQWHLSRMAGEVSGRCM